MSRKQKICLWIGIVVFILMGLFPPSMYDGGVVNLVGEGETETRCFKGYMFILNNTDMLIDVSRLFVQWIMVAVITGGLILTSQKKKN
ncbi:MAG: hypothetical protein WAK60_06725 [Sedimentisphaerales bacterium]